MNHIKKFDESAGMSSTPTPKNRDGMSLEELVDMKYEDQNPRLTSYQITSILRTLKNNIDRLRAKGMNKLANDKEIVLRGIINKLS